MKTYIIIPGFNEARDVSKVLKECLQQTPNVIYVDDGSVDGSVTLAQKTKAIVLIHETNLGKGAALKTGCEYAFTNLGADAVIFMDADDQHSPDELPRFFKALEDADCVFGSRRMGINMPLFRFVWNKLISVLLNILYGVYIPDIPSGYKALSKKAYTKVKWEARGYEVEVEIAARVAKNRLPFTLLDIESIYHDEEKGMTMLDGLRIAWSVLKMRMTV